MKDFFTKCVQIHKKTAALSIFIKKIFHEQFYFYAVLVFQFGRV